VVLICEVHGESVMILHSCFIIPNCRRSVPNKSKGLYSTSIKHILVEYNDGTMKTKVRNIVTKVGERRSNI